jgi:Ca-activated chloride channel homolog
MIALPLMSEPITADGEAGIGCLATVVGNLPLQAVDIDAHVTGLLHATRVRQTFLNTHDEPLEATYIFPLPDRAAVTAFRMEVGDRIVVGLLEERAAARRAYSDAIAEGRQAAIAEEERPNIFTVRVGNLLPGDRATIELMLVGPLALDSGEATWRFPLVVAPRYIPGSPLPGGQVGDGTELDTDAVPDASRITPPVLLPGFPNPVRLSIRVDLDGAGLPVSRIRSSLPARIDGTVVTIEPGARLDRDLVVRFDVGVDTVSTSLVTHDGTFALTLVPPVRAAGHAKPRDVVFVLDRSGSMEGWKMTAARRAVARMVDTLGAADRFAVLAFDDRVETAPTLAAGLVSATDRHRFRAIEFLASLDSRGGTELLAPLQTAASLLANDEPLRERVLILATDGQVGNEDQILAAVAPKASDIRIFTVGIDTAVNDAFLRRLAAVGGGSCEVVESEDRLDDVMDRIHRRIGTPVLSNIVITTDGATTFELDPASLAPARLPALHEGAPLVVLGRCAKDAAGSVRVTATGADGKPWSTDVVRTDGGSAALAATWARARLRDLEDRYVVSAGDESIEREIVRTSLEGQVLSRFTAFIAADVVVVVDGGRSRQVTQPVEMPHGWNMPIPSAPPMVGAAGGFAPAPQFHFGAAAKPMAPPAPMASMAKRRSGAGDSRRYREEALDFTPYRTRATRLAERVSSGELDADGLRRELVELVNDLRSVGASDADVSDLVTLIAAIDAGVWTLDPLSEFATGKQSKRAFWKR